MAGCPDLIVHNRGPSATYDGLAYRADTSVLEHRNLHLKGVKVLEAGEQIYTVKKIYEC